MPSKIALFQRKEIRRTAHNDEWWFVIADIIVALTDSVDPAAYLKNIRRRDPAFAELFDKRGRGKLPPPCPALPNGGRHAAHPRMEYRGHFPAHPIHPQSEGGAVQALAGARRL